MRRELWESLSDILSAFIPGEHHGMCIRGVDVRLPIELVMPKTEVGFRFLADAPRIRWHHGLTNQPCHIRIVARSAVLVGPTPPPDESYGGVEVESGMGTPSSGDSDSGALHRTQRRRSGPLAE